MYLIDHVAELRFVNRLIYAIKRIYTQVILNLWVTIPLSHLTLCQMSTGTFKKFVEKMLSA